MRQCGHADEGDHGEGDVGVQGHTPGQALNDQSAREQPERRTAAGYRGVDPEGPAAFLRVGEAGGHQGQRGRRQQRGSDALQSAGKDQRAGNRGRPAHRGGHREADQADDQHPFAAHEIREVPAEQQQSHEGHRIDEGQRTQVCGADVQVGLEDGIAMLKAGTSISTISCTRAAITRAHQRLGCGGAASWRWAETGAGGAAGQATGDVTGGGPNACAGPKCTGAVGAYAGGGGGGWEAGWDADWDWGWGCGGEMRGSGGVTGVAGSGVAGVAGAGIVGA